MTFSDEEVHQQVANLVVKFEVFQCEQCAEVVKDWLKENKIKGKHIKISTAGGEDFIVSDRWDNGRSSITQNGTHQGIEVCGKVFDNLSSTGLSKIDWINDFSCLSGSFIVEEVERF